MITRAEMSYDDRRDTPHPCRCGLRVTMPELCERERRCLFGRLPRWDDRLHRGQPDAGHID